MSSLFEHVRMDSSLTMNCSLMDETILNITDTDNVSLVELNKITILCEVFISVVLVSLAFDTVGKKINQLPLLISEQYEHLFSAKNVFRALALLALSIILPVVSVILSVCFLYKLICTLLIKHKDERFVKYLDSFDVFWCLEDDASKSVINVLGIIESDSSSVLVDNIKEKLTLIPHNKVTEKIFYRRNEDYGFYYWRKHDRNSINMGDYVHLIELPKSDKDKLETMYLEELMTEVSNLPLPYNDEGLFQILVTRDRVGNSNAERGEYAIIFRIHHSVGDGLALIDFLCKTLADPLGSNPVLFPMSEVANTRKTNTFNNLTKMMKSLIEMPICLIDGILRKPDKNCLHGPKLLGRKIFRWKESKENLLKMIKDIKTCILECNFSDILATALSKGLQNYFSKTMNNVPAEVAVIIPVRFPKNNDKGLPLENDFSVTILDLPTKTSNRIEDVKKRCSELRESADPLTNHYLLKIIAGVLPNAVLKSALLSNQATMVFSNMPGPELLSICGGKLKKLVFFVPNKGNTGLGITALCYGGALRIAAMADAALVSSSEDLSLILDGMEAEIVRLHQQYMRY